MHRMNGDGTAPGPMHSMVIANKFRFRDYSDRKVDRLSNSNLASEPPCYKKVTPS